MTEIIFEVIEDDVDGGYSASALASLRRQSLMGIASPVPMRVLVN